MDHIYEQASYRVHCASTLTERFALDKPGEPPITDRFYWENIRFLDSVVDCVSPEDHDNHDLFMKARGWSGMLPVGMDGLRASVEGYKRIIEAYGKREEIPADLQPARAEMIDVFRNVMAINADICRKNTPSYHRPR